MEWCYLLVACELRSSSSRRLYSTCTEVQHRRIIMHLKTAWLYIGIAVWSSGALPVFHFRFQFPGWSNSRQQYGTVHGIMDV